MNARWTCLTHAVLAFGVALRLALALATPPERAYDDHYPPVYVILTQHRIPDAADCWECYQPPLYYLVSAGLTVVAEQLTGADLETIARRVLQMVSVAAGSATLYLCWRVYRLCNGPRSLEPLACGLVAVLPAHVQISAMATNDAFTHLLATAAICFALRAGLRGWRSRDCVAAGLLAGASVLAKAYGWATVVAITAATAWATRRQPAALLLWPRLRLSRAAAVTLAAAPAVGLWPGLRNLYTFGRFHVDNFELRDTPMRFQPPGSVARISFFSFRLRELLRHPWLHMSHVDSFWTQLYGRMWFDYEGFNTTLAPYPKWQQLWRRCAERCPTWEPARWQMLLSYRPDEVPPAYRPVAVACYLAGLPITVWLLAGLACGLWRGRHDWRLFLLALHLVLALAVPLVQALRLPHFAAMKAAFALSGVSSMPVLAVQLAPVRPRTLLAAVQAALWAVVAIVGVAQVAFVWLAWHTVWPAES